MKVDISILNAPLNDIESYLGKIQNLEYIHMDIMDGKFVPNHSFNSDIVKRCRDSFKDKIIDTHLMVQDPINLINEYSSVSDYITIHLEANNVKETLELIKKHNVKCGLSIKPNTDIKNIIPFLKDIDIVLIMSVEPGLGGQNFILSSIDKVKFLYDYRKENNLNYLINIDGGINENTYMLIKDYCDLAVVGSAITKTTNYNDTYDMYYDLFK